MTLNIEQFVDAMQSGKLLEARVVKVYDRAAIISIGDEWAKFFTKKSSLSALREGSIVNVRIFGVDEKRQRIYATDIGTDNAGQSGREILDSIKLSDIYFGTVAAILEKGLVISFAGVTGFLSKTEIHWSRNKQVPDRYKVGDRIEVVVVHVSKNNRIHLSAKQLQPHPFEEFYKRASRSPKTVYFGEVSKVMDYGIFVHLDDAGLEGLLHVSQLGVNKAQLLTDEAKERIVSLLQIPVTVEWMDVDKRRVSLKFAGGNFDELMNAWWPPVGSRFSGRLVRPMDGKIQFMIDDGKSGYLFESDDPGGFFDSSFFYSPGSILPLEVLGFDARTKSPRFKCVAENSPVDSVRIDRVLENYLEGAAAEDVSARIGVKHPYFILAKHLQSFKNRRLSKVFDYIFHFGCVVDVDDIRLFGLAHRASIEFKLRRNEFALGLITFVLRDAIRLRRGYIVRLATGILKKHAEVVWG